MSSRCVRFSLAALVAFLVASSGFADEVSAFNPSAFLSDANDTVSSIYTALEILLGVCATYQIMLLGYQLYRECVLGIIEDDGPAEDATEVDDDSIAFRHDGLEFENYDELEDYYSYENDTWDKLGYPDHADDE